MPTEIEITEGDEHIRAIHTAIDLAKAAKPNDHGEVDRYFAILITDLERVLAFAAVYTLT